MDVRGYDMESLGTLEAAPVFGAFYTIPTLAVLAALALAIVAIVFIIVISRRRS
jgi:hypothetical protein